MAERPETPEEFMLSVLGALGAKTDSEIEALIRARDRAVAAAALEKFVNAWPREPIFDKAWIRKEAANDLIGWGSEGADERRDEYHKMQRERDEARDELARMRETLEYSRLALGALAQGRSVVPPTAAAPAEPPASPTP